MSLAITVDPDSTEPPFDQIRNQVLAQIADGHLRVGDHLPPIRTLATDLGLAAGTVARAYRALEGAGVVSTRRRAGTVVANGAAPREVVAHSAAHTFVTTARNAGLDDETIIAVVHQALTREHVRDIEATANPEVAH